MRDVGSQLAEYFEAATERIDPEDVLAHVRVTEQARRPARRRLRPAWVAAAGFVGVLAVLGGALLAGVLLHDPTAVEPQPLGTPVAEPSAGWGWWPLVAGAALMIALVVLVSRRLHRATKEAEMQKLDEKQQEARETRARRRSRMPWLISLAIVVVVAGAIGAWAMIEASQTNDADIAAEFAEAWERGDPEAVAPLLAEDAVLEDFWGQTYRGRENVSEYAGREGLAWMPLTGVRTGAITEAGDGTFTFTHWLTWGDQGTTSDEVELTIEDGLVAHVDMPTLGRSE